MAKSSLTAPKNASEITQPTQRNLIKTLDIKQAEFSDITAAFKSGIVDFFKRPFLSSFFGLVYVILGLIIVAGLIYFNNIWITLTAGVGFPLVAPFLAAGLYEMSRCFEGSKACTLNSILTVIMRQQGREFSMMAYVILFIFLFWLAQVHLPMIFFDQWNVFSSLEGIRQALSTSGGIGFLAFGTAIGAILSTILYSLTVISMPLLLDKEIDFISAMIVSVQTVIKSPVVMLFWGATIAVLIFAAMVPLFTGLIIVLPVLGHTTWHLYRRLITDKG